MAARFLGPMLIARLMSRRKKSKQSLSDEQKKNPHLEEQSEETIEH